MRYQREDRRSANAPGRSSRHRQRQAAAGDSVSNTSLANDGHAPSHGNNSAYQVQTSHAPRAGQTSEAAQTSHVHHRDPGARRHASSDSDASGEDIYPGPMWGGAQYTRVLHSSLDRLGRLETNGQPAHLGAVDQSVWLFREACSRGSTPGEYVNAFPVDDVGITSSGIATAGSTTYQDSFAAHQDADGYTAQPHQQQRATAYPIDRGRIQHDHFLGSGVPRNGQADDASSPGYEYDGAGPVHVDADADGVGDEGAYPGPANARPGRSRSHATSSRHHGGRQHRSRPPMNASGGPGSHRHRRSHQPGIQNDNAHHQDQIALEDGGLIVDGKRRQRRNVELQQVVHEFESHFPPRAH